MVIILLNHETGYILLVCKINVAVHPKYPTTQKNSFVFVCHETAYRANGSFHTILAMIDEPEHRTASKPILISH